MEGASLTRQSSVQTQKALEWNTRRPRAVSSDREDTIEIIEEAPAFAVRAFTSVAILRSLACELAPDRFDCGAAGERPAISTATPNQFVQEKANARSNAQMKVLTDLVQSLLKAVEGQTSAMEELKKEHASQIEAPTRKFAGQIETLKAEVAELIQVQLANI